MGEQEASLQLQQRGDRSCYMLQQAELRAMAGSPARIQQRRRVRKEGPLLIAPLPFTGSPLRSPPWGPIPPLEQEPATFPVSCPAGFLVKSGRKGGWQQSQEGPAQAAHGCGGSAARGDLSQPSTLCLLTGMASWPHISDESSTTPHGWLCELPPPHGLSNP